MKSKSKIYGIADTHFNYTRIIEYAKRPFKNVEEMNETLIQNWNDSLFENDVIHILGDFGFGSTESLTKIVNQLKGIISDESTIQSVAIRYLRKSAVLKETPTLGGGCAFILFLLR